jgi:hypothetical protein
VTEVVKKFPVMPVEFGVKTVVFVPPVGPVAPVVPVAVAFAPVGPVAPAGPVIVFVRMTLITCPRIVDNALSS